MKISNIILSITLLSFLLIGTSTTPIKRGDKEKHPITKKAKAKKCGPAFRVDVDPGAPVPNVLSFTITGPGGYSRTVTNPTFPYEVPDVLSTGQYTFTFNIQKPFGRGAIYYRYVNPAWCNECNCAQYCNDSSNPTITVTSYCNYYVIYLIGNGLCVFC